MKGIVILHCGDPAGCLCFCTFGFSISIYKERSAPVAAAQQCVNKRFVDHNGNRRVKYLLHIKSIHYFPFLFWEFQLLLIDNHGGKICIQDIFVASDCVTKYWI